MPPGTIVDLLCTSFGWRGKYIVIKTMDNGLIKIKNCGTNSQQCVSLKRLRRSILPQFSITSLKK